MWDPPRTPPAQGAAPPVCGGFGGLRGPLTHQCPPAQLCLAFWGVLGDSGGCWGFGGPCPPCAAPARWAAPPSYECLWGGLEGSLTLPCSPSSTLPPPVGSVGGSLTPPCPPAQWAALPAAVPEASTARLRHPQEHRGRGVSVGGVRGDPGPGETRGTPTLQGTPALQGPWGDSHCVCSPHSCVPTCRVHCPLILYVPSSSPWPIFVSPCPLHVPSCPPSHIFLGFSKCGRYVLSYTSSSGDDDFSFYLYHLYWWEFNVHSKLRLVGDSPGHPGTLGTPLRTPVGTPRPLTAPPRCARCGSSRTRRFTVTFT